MRSGDSARRGDSTEGVIRDLLASRSSGAPSCSSVDGSRPRRSRTTTRQPPVAGTHPIAPPRAVSPNTGPLAAARCLIGRGLSPSEPRWFVEITLTADQATQLRIEIYAEEWGFMFQHDGN